MDLYQRRAFLEGDNFTAPGEGEVLRDKVCPVEIWCECFGKKQGDFNLYETKEINKILDKIPGWKKSKNGNIYKPYGRQRGYRRC